MRNKVRPLLLGFAAVAALAVSLPVVGQDRPESILPPGFNDPEPAPRPKPSDPPKKAEPSPSQSSEGGGEAGPEPQSTSKPRPAVGNGGQPTKTTTATGVPGQPKKPGEEEEYDPDAPVPIIVDIPAQSRRPINLIGTLAVIGDGDMGQFAFQNFNGLWMASVMDGIKAPIASRWASILMRRALLTKSLTPGDINGANWAASRTALLFRMGEANAARGLAQAVDADLYTPKLMDAAMDAAMASADPAALCGITDYVKTTDKEMTEDKNRTVRWRLAKAMCSGLSGESAVANANLERARDALGENNIDVLLPEKVVGAGANTRRSVVIEWEEVNELTPWRFGLASATALPIPERLYATMGRQVRGWQALAPLLPPAERLAAADQAAELGVLSSAALVDLYSVRYDATDPAERTGKPFQYLREAYIGSTPATRIAAMRQLWKADDGVASRYAGLIVTAKAAATIPASDEFSGDAGPLIAALLSAGYDRTASKWVKVIGDQPANAGWGLLAVGATSPIPDITAGMIDDFGGTSSANAKQKARLLFAALAGLGRLPQAEIETLAERFDVPIGRKSSWQSALAAAANANAPGAVAVLCGVGLQAKSWADVPAAHLFHIMRALRQVGHEAEARMIAAEALARL